MSKCRPKQTEETGEESNENAQLMPTTLPQSLQPMVQTHTTPRELAVLLATADEKRGAGNGVNTYPNSSTVAEMLQHQRSTTSSAHGRSHTYSESSRPRRDLSFTNRQIRQNNTAEWKGHAR